MKTTVLLVCALALIGSDALAAKVKGIRVTGCAIPVGFCPALRTTPSGGFFLTGPNLPPARSRVTVRGEFSGKQDFLCPTRLIMRGTITVKSWKYARGKC